MNIFNYITLGAALLMILLGGLGALHGPILGAFALTLVRELGQSITERQRLVEGAGCLLRYKSNRYFSKRKCLSRANFSSKYCFRHPDLALSSTRPSAAPRA